MDEMTDFNKMPISEQELLERLTKLASAIVALKEKLLGKIALNPDYERYSFWDNQIKYCGINKKNNMFVALALRRLKIQGLTIGIHGTSQNEIPLSEIAKLSMGISQSEKTRKPKGSIMPELSQETLKDFTDNMSKKGEIIETSRNLEKKKKRDVEQLKEDENKISLLEKKLKELENDIKIKDTKSTTIINNNPVENKDTENNDLKKKEKNIENEGL